MTTSTLVFLLGLTAIFIAFIVLGILWAIKNGQFEDMEGPAQRILMDDDDPMLPSNQLGPDKPEDKSKLQ
ncbi:cbb3-type cytochrome oxidase assembly protein CcoS [Sulfuriferula thiophila]|uniref:cbb3-type cytochrome oxidase assembly protein CcoS n=1 Tax=Sulfuriferula thiophila TaxID=1781211 RepID=UPI000F60D9A0|nr:cbb3-type cytochrome oxidase assembly protein CcoS [Sulfuriferula thiophila]